MNFSTNGRIITGAGYTIATDGDDASISLAKDNISINLKDSSCIHCEQLLWGNDVHMKNIATKIAEYRNLHSQKYSTDHIEKADIVLAADV